MAEIDDVRYEVAIANRVLSEVGLATGVLASLGHASLRVPGEPEKEPPETLLTTAPAM